MKKAQPPATTQQNLPSNQPPQILCELATPSTPHEAIELNDLALINIWGYNLCNQWNQPNITLKGLSTLGTQTLKFIQVRRKLLKMDYGRPTDNPKGKSIVYPLD